VVKELPAPSARVKPPARVDHRLWCLAAGKLGAGFFTTALSSCLDEFINRSDNSSWYLAGAHFEASP